MQAATVTNARRPLWRATVPSTFDEVPSDGGLRYLIFLREPYRL